MAAPAKESSALQRPPPSPSLASHESEIDVCSICLDPRNSDDIDTQQELVTLRCRHVFHSACIQAWMAKHSTCPLCRIPRKNASATAAATAAQIPPVEVPTISSSSSGSSSDDDDDDDDVDAEEEDVAYDLVRVPAVPAVRDDRIARRIQLASKPVSAYVIFSRVARQQVCEQQPHASLTEITKAVAQQWRELPDHRRQLYFQSAEAYKAQYWRDLFHTARAHEAAERRE